MSQPKLNISIDDKFSKRLDQQQAAMQRLMPELYEVFLENTPIREGNARRRTRLERNRIVADYAYAGVLDSGASKQSPEGMSKPTVEYATKRFEQIMKRGN